MIGQYLTQKMQKVPNICMKHIQRNLFQMSKNYFPGSEMIIDVMVTRGGLAIRHFKDIFRELEAFFNSFEGFS
jgi:hypothetical protein